MDAVLLARLQFAMTVGFHYVFPPLTIGLAWLIAYFMYRGLRPGGGEYKAAARFWLRLFVLSFALGVATGITMEFQFGTNWAAYSRFVGDVFGAPLAAEGILAFFMESIFLGVLFFGEDRLSPRTHFVSALMVAVGSTLSGFWIIAANSWQQTPAGHVIGGGRAELSDFAAAVFNPSTMPRYLHTIAGALLTGAFFMMGVAAWYLLKGRHESFAKKSLAAGLALAVVAAPGQLVLGHYHAVQVAETQPAKLAAFEGLWETQRNAPLLVFGVPDVAEERTRMAIGVPGLLSLGVAGTFDKEVKGLKDFPKEDRPPVLASFGAFHLMVGIGMYLIAFSAWGAFLWRRRRLFEQRLFLRLAFLSIPLPFAANELGWIAAEVGRQPWAVYGILRTKDAVSATVSAAQIMFSITVFAFIYALLLTVWLYLLKAKIVAGPDGHRPAAPAGGGKAG
jgi:cytochrome d ubiquinol oxidase subunit I